MLVRIIPYEPAFKEDFKKLNIAWLEQFFTVEPIDEIIFENPERYILDKGGAIFFAELNNEIIGTFALMYNESGDMELAKMAVRKDMQGQQIGSKMLQHAIDTAVKMGVKRLILFSNTKLQAAIHLYSKYGFKEIPLGENSYKRSNIKMELTL